MQRLKKDFVTKRKIATTIKTVPHSEKTKQKINKQKDFFFSSYFTSFTTT